MPRQAAFCITVWFHEPDRGTREGLEVLGSGVVRELHVMHCAT